MSAAAPAPEWWATVMTETPPEWTPGCITSRSAADYVTSRLPVHPYQAYRLLDQLKPFRHGMRYWYHRADLDALIARGARR
jgi:hypothetical protein